MSYDYSYGYYDYSTPATNAALIGGAILVPLLISLLVTLFSIICMWKVFKKAGKNGWEAIIPIYNIIVLLQITELPLWYLILLIIPVGNVVALILIYLELAKKFNKGGGFAAGLILLNPIFMAILAFDKNCVYNGNAQAATEPMMNPTFSQQPIEPVVNNPIPQQPVEPVVNNPMPQQPVVNNPVPQQPVEPVVNNPIPQQPVTKPCPTCGSQVEQNAAVCGNCGYKFY